MDIAQLQDIMKFSPDVLLPPAPVCTYIQQLIPEDRRSVSDRDTTRKNNSCSLLWVLIKPAKIYREFKIRATAFTNRDSLLVLDVGTNLGETLCRVTMCNILLLCLAPPNTLAVVLSPLMRVQGIFAEFGILPTT